MTLGYDLVLYDGAIESLNVTLFDLLHSPVLSLEGSTLSVTVNDSPVIVTKYIWEKSIISYERVGNGKSFLALRNRKLFTCSDSLDYDSAGKLLQCIMSTIQHEMPSIVLKSCLLHAKPCNHVIGGVQ